MKRPDGSLASVTAIDVSLETARDTISLPDTWRPSATVMLVEAAAISQGIVDKQVRLQLFALAYNLGNFLRRLALPQSVKH